MNWTFDETFHRRIIFSNIPISGTFKIPGIFQMGLGKNTWPEYQVGVYKMPPIVLEYDSSCYKDYEKLGFIKDDDFKKLQEAFRHLDFQKEILALLSLIGNANFFVVKAYSLEKGELGDNYFSPEFSLIEGQKEIEINDSHFFKEQNVYGDKVAFPKKAEIFFKNYFTLNPIHLRRFRMSLALYYNSIDIQENSPSMSYIALISAIENLVDLEGEINGFKAEVCAECTQKRYKLTRRFKDFMIRYCSLTTPEFTRYLGKAYSKRSSVAHLGRLFYMDFANTEIDYQGVKELNQLKKYVRIALYNWIIRGPNIS